MPPSAAKLRQKSISRIHRRLAIDKQLLPRCRKPSTIRKVEGRILNRMLALQQAYSEVHGRDIPLIERKGKVVPDIIKNLPPPPPFVPRVIIRRTKPKE